MSGLPPLPKSAQDFANPVDMKLHDFVSGQAPLAKTGKRQMLDTPFVGACTVCKLTGSISVDPVDYKSLERVLDGKVIKADCPKCRKKTEFRPLKPEELAEEGFYIMRRNEEIRAKIFRAAEAKGKSVPDHVKEALDEYMKRMDHALGRKQTPEGLIVPEGKIITPE